MWSDTSEKYTDARVIFIDTEESNWTFDPVRRQFYWHRFFSHQPDLNYDNPAVQEAMIDVLRFWLDLGIDGFRLDAVPYLFEREGTNCENLPETHAFLKRVRKVVDDEFPGRVLLAEANQWPADVVEYFGDASTGGDECHMAFHFPLMPRIFMAVRRESRFPISEILAQTPEIPDMAQWGIFLRNHDELTLEMVTDEERDYMYSEYAKDPRMKANVGIRRRLAPLLDNDRNQIELFTALLLSLPGSPVLYYGDEIGMGDVIWLGDRDGVRTPMQWTPDRNAGFSKANPGRLYLPPSQDSVYGYQAVNVEAQRDTSTSLLNFTRMMLAVRRRHDAFAIGRFEELGGSNPSVLAFLRQAPDERRHRAVRQQSVAVPPAPRVEPATLERPHADRAHRAGGVPAHRPPALFADPAGTWVLLVPAVRIGGELMTPVGQAALDANGCHSNAGMPGATANCRPPSPASSSRCATDLDWCWSTPTTPTARPSAIRCSSAGTPSRSSEYNTVATIGAADDRTGFDALYDTDAPPVSAVADRLVGGRDSTGTEVAFG